MNQNIVVTTAYPSLEPFLVSPMVATCHQGAQQRPVFVIAMRSDTVLYADGNAHRYGVAYLSAARQGHVFAGSEHPNLESAIVMFLDDRSAAEPE